MKRIIVPILTFILGVCLGVAVMIAIVQRGPNQVIAQLARGLTSEQAIYGALLHEKRYDDLQRLIENGFLISLNYQKEVCFSPKEYLASQKYVRGYFDLTGRPIPVEIDQQIQNIPRGSGIDIHRLADAVTTQKIQ